MILNILEKLRRKKSIRTSQVRQLQTVYTLRKTAETNPENPLITLQATGKDLVAFIFHKFQDRNALTYATVKTPHHSSTLITSRINYDTNTLRTRFQALQPFRERAMLAIQRTKFRTKEHVEALRTKTEELKQALLEVLTSK